MKSITLPLSSAARVEVPARANALGEAALYLFNAISNWNHRRITRNELLALDDRLLLDIGLSRADAVDFDSDPRRRND